MNSWYPQHPYPVTCLPENIQSFIRQVQGATQASEELVAPVVLSAMSAAVQGLVDIKSADGYAMPTSLFLGVIVPSGERKSSVLRHVLKAFEEFEQFGMDADKAQPFLLEETTEQGLADLFQQGIKSVFFALSEGSQMLRTLNHAAFCKRFDGATIRYTSRKTGTLTFRDTRGAVCMLIQNESFRRYMHKKSDIMIESGFLPRMLVSFPTETANFQSAQYVLQTNEDPQDHTFHNRTLELLCDYAKAQGRGDQRRQMLLLHQNAHFAWQQFYVHTTQLLHQSADDGSWAGVEAFVKRAGEHVLRLAAVLQWFDKPQRYVEEQYVQAAIQIVIWHLHQARCAFGIPPIEVQVAQWAETLYGYLWRQFQTTGTVEPFTRSELLRCAPTIIRKADRLRAAVNHLLLEGRITRKEEEKKEYLTLDPYPRYRTQPPLNPSSPFVPGLFQ